MWGWGGGGLKQIMAVFGEGFIKKGMWFEQFLRWVS